MHQESGRSLIEVIGVLAITGVMAASSFGLYNMIRKNQVRTIASSELESIVKNTRLLMGARGTYEGLSVEYLIDAGALTSNKAPIGGENWSVVPSYDGTTFTINLTDLSEGECAYFANAMPKWAIGMLINGYEQGAGANCFSTQTNQVSLIAQ